MHKPIDLSKLPSVDFSGLSGSLSDGEITGVDYQPEAGCFVVCITAKLVSATKSAGTNWQNKVRVKLENTKQKASAETAMSACSLPSFIDKVPGVTSELMKELRDELAKSIKAGDYSAESKKGDIKLSVNILPDEVKLLLEAKRLKHK